MNRATLSAGLLMLKCLRHFTRSQQVLGCLVLKCLRHFTRSQQVLAYLAAVLLCSCVTSVPIEDYTIARTAYESARDADALRLAPGLWYSAEEAYHEGQRAYKERRYDDARESFEKSIKFSEKAENAARLERHNSGDAP